MKTLEGRVALVTGASRGLGRAIAVRLAARGAVVAAAARGDNAAGTVEEIRDRIYAALDAQPRSDTT